MDSSVSGPESLRSALAKATPQQLAALLAEAGAVSPELMRKLQDLGARAQLSDAEFPEVAPTAEVPAREEVGARIGPYRLLQQLGEGGMGTVFLAEQHHPVERRVALTIIKAGMDTRQALARFEAERQALAMMDHPNIAKVFDAGTAESGRPYFVMELVKGEPITDYCDRQHLTLRQRLELFLSVCNAIQHAHQKGIIHRDIKPSNVLVAEIDGRSAAKVIDFGVAKAISQPLTAKTIFTGFGQIVGTLEYMSPEQAGISQLDVDTRSDIYSLGVLLYELLTGKTPFDRQRLRSAAWDEMLRIIREEEPPKPSTRLSESKGSLPSVSAQRQTEPAKLTKLVRGELDWIVMKALEKDRGRRYETAGAFAADVRHYLNDEAVAAGPPSAAYRLRKLVVRNRGKLAVVVVLAASLMVTLTGVGWAIRDRSAQRAAWERDRSDRENRRTSQLALIITDAKQQAREQRWNDSLTVAKRGESFISGEDVDPEVLRQFTQLLADLEFVQRLEEIRLDANSWAEVANLSVAERSYSDTFREAGLDVDNSSAADMASCITARDLISAPIIAALDDWMSFRGKVQNTAGRNRLIEIALAADPDPWRQRFRTALLRDDLAELDRLAASDEATKQPPSCVLSLAMAMHVTRRVELLKRAQVRHPDDYWLNYRLGKLLIGPEMAKDPIELQEGLGYLRATVALRPGWIGGHINVARALARLDRFDEALTWCHEIVELGPIWGYRTMGEILSHEGRLDEAVAANRRLIELDPTSAAPQCDLGRLMVQQGKPEEGVACFRRAIELEPQSVPAHYNLGVLLSQLKKFDEAIVCYGRAIEIDPMFVDAHNNLGAVLCEQDKLDEAVAAWRRLLELAPTHIAANSNLGVVLERQGKLDEAIACWRKLIELDPKNPVHYCSLAPVLARTGELDEAIICLRKAIDLDPQFARGHCDLGFALELQGIVDEAIACYRHAIELDPNYALAHANLGDALARQGKLNDAITCFRQTLRLNPDDVRMLNNLSWYLATAQDVTLRNPQEAVDLAQKATALQPNDGNSWDNLGVALYRAAQWQAAREALETARTLLGGKDMEHQFFLAMTYWQLGDRDMAKACFEEAAAWLDEKTRDEEQYRFRDEAKQLIGTADSLAPDGLRTEDELQATDQSTNESGKAKSQTGKQPEP